MNEQNIKDWTNDCPIIGIYLVKNIRFERDGKSVNELLHATQFTWQALNDWTADGHVCYTTEEDCLLAYYRMQAFLYFECQFDLERVNDDQLRQHLIEVNNLLSEQPYDYSYDLGYNCQTTTETVEFLHPETWLAVIPDSYEFCLYYIADPDLRKKLLDQAVFEYLIHTLPVTIFTKEHHLTKTTLTDPNLIDDLIGFDIPTDTVDNFKQFVVSHAFGLPMSFKYDEYKQLQ